MKKIARSRGQSLFEVLAAVAVIGVALVALISLSTRSVSTGSFARNKNLASRYTQEAYEWIRLERDTDWSLLYARAGSTYCINNLNWSSPGSCGGYIRDATTGANTIFQREVSLTAIDVAELEVDIVTSWRSGGSTHSSRSTTILSDWRSL